jgi:hypothetical protein
LKLIEENEFEKLLDKENLKAKAIEYAEQYGIIFVVSLCNVLRALRNIFIRMKLTKLLYNQNQFR